MVKRMDKRGVESYVLWLIAALVLVMIFWIILGRISDVFS